MRLALRLGYAAAAQIARAAAAIAPPSSSKLIRSLRGRRGIRARYTEWARDNRDDSRPLLWMHAPSVGEGLQARPVLELARSRRPDVQLAYTYFSPSAEPMARALDVDFRDYLPFDTNRDAAIALESLRPRALVFAKLDVWPTLALNASRRGVRLGIISATLARQSSRRSSGAAALLHDAYHLLDAVGVIDPDDAERLVELGVRPGAIEVTGDTRYDQVWARAHGVDRQSALLRSISRTVPTLVAGSTWPADEAELLPAFIRVLGTIPDARLIIAPHEPTPVHLQAVERWAERSRISIARLGSPQANEATVVLIDRVGVLGDIYALADVAYVGGGFHEAGLHSVLEPAAFGAPVLFGPRFDASRDAVLMVERGGGRSTYSSEKLASHIVEWLGSPASRTLAGERARALVRSGLGAAERSFRLVARLLG